jgi:hypothetical protein
LVRKHEGRDNLKNLGVDGRIILKCIFKGTELKDMCWICLVESRDKCRVLMHVANTGVGGENCSRTYALAV